MPGQEPHPTSSALVAAVERLLAEPARSGVLALLAPLTLDVLPAAQHVSVSLCSKDGMITVAASDPRASVLDDMERHIGEGPGLTAAQEGVAFLVADLAHDPRWPRLAAHAAGGILVRSVLSLPLRGGEAAGSLNASSPEVGAFTEAGSTAAVVFAAAAGLALRAAEERERADRGAARAAQLQQFIALVAEDLQSGTAAALSAGQRLHSRRPLSDPIGRQALDQLNDALRQRQRLILELLDLAPPDEDAR